MYSFPSLESVHCSTSSSDCCFLTSTQISQEAGKVVWYSHLLKNFPQFIVIHTVKGFSIVSKAEVDISADIFFSFMWVRAKRWAECLAHGSLQMVTEAMKLKDTVCVSRSVVPNSLRPHGLQSTRFLCPCDFPGKDTFPSPGDLPNPGIQPRSPALQENSLSTELQGKP